MQNVENAHPISQNWSRGLNPTARKAGSQQMRTQASVSTVSTTRAACLVCRLTFIVSCPSGVYELICPWEITVPYPSAGWKYVSVGGASQVSFLLDLMRRSMWCKTQYKVPCVIIWIWPHLARSLR